MKRKFDYENVNNSKFRKMRELFQHFLRILTFLRTKKKFNPIFKFKRKKGHEYT